MIGGCTALMLCAEHVCFVMAGRKIQLQLIQV